MDRETPADAWYVWAGAGLIAAAMLGVAVSLPAQPPPDAQQAANTVDRAAANSMGASASYEHDADVVLIGPTRIQMRNDGGESSASVSFGRMAPVHGNEDLEEILHGASPADQYGLDWNRRFHAAVEAAEGRAVTAVEDDEWRRTSGTLRVRVLEYVDGSGDRHTAVLVDA